ncbi:MAG TPA: hypothetical protein VGG40_13560 [Solirubrobacterales bacterium]|jgi:hypothetical protein
MRRAVRPAVALATLAIWMAALTGTAFAWFASTGGGSVQITASTLTAPTISAATAAAGGTVTLTWGAVTAPGSGTVGYYVTRDGGEPAGNCPTRAEPESSITTCKDAEVPIGEHSYKVVAVYHGWTRTSAAKTAKVTIGETVKFTISGSTTTPSAGGADNLTITAKDAGNSTVTTYAGSHSFVFAGAEEGPLGNKPTVVNSSGTAIVLGSPTALTFTSGVASVSSSKNGVLKIYNAGPASITATSEEMTTPTPLALSVGVTATQFKLEAATATPALGDTDSTTITASDAYGNVATTYTGSKSLTFSGAAASPGGNTPTVTNSSGTAIAFGSATTIAFTEGVAESSGGDGGKIVLYKPGATSITAKEGSTVTTPTALVLTPPIGAAAKLALTSSTTTPTAGTAFNLTTTVQDAYGNTVTSYSGSHNITFSGASASPSGTLPTVANSSGTAISFGSAVALNFSAGVATVSGSTNGQAKLYKSGATSVTATDGTHSTASALALTVSAGTASRVAVSGLVASPGSVGSPCLFTCMVTSLGNSGTINAKVAITDANGNIVSAIGATKSVTVSATGGSISGSPLPIPSTGSAISSSEFTFTAPSSGTYSVTISTASVGYTGGTVTASK